MQCKYIIDSFVIDSNQKHISRVPIQKDVIVDGGGNTGGFMRVAMQLS